MLQELRIRNFAIVDLLRITFGEGLNVITGETGAGKSLLVNAIDLILGGRARSDFIKEGADEAWIEAFFEADHLSALDSLGISSDGELLIKRMISRSGKSRAYINDSPVTIQTLSSLGNSLVDLHGQHEHQSLLSTAVQRTIVDSFGGLEDSVKKVGEEHEEFQTLQNSLTVLKEKSRQKEERVDLLQYQIDEIDSAALQPDEKKGLVEEKSILSNLTSLRGYSEESFSLLKDADGSVLENLGRTIRLIEDLNRIDTTSEELLRIMRDAEAMLQDAGHTVRELKEKYDCDPVRLEDIESRLALIDSLERKYGPGIDAILAHRADASTELEELQDYDQRLSEMEAKLQEIDTKLSESAEGLSRERKKKSMDIEKKIKKLLSELAFSHPDFKIKVSEAPISSTGIDRVEFLFSANPGQPPMPLKRIASGGELSRVMLALKNIFASVDRIPVLIFDEVDAGVGGKTADSVSIRLKRLAEKHQVICITHLPQIASRANNHIFIDKQHDDGGVTVNACRLDHDERVKEVARMLSGEVTESSLKHAADLIGKGQA